MREEKENYPALGIGDISKILGVADHTLRYWEKEFSEHLSPSRTAGRQRRYCDADIEVLARIKKLLKDEGYSIKGAKRILDGNRILTELSSRENGAAVYDTHSLALQIAEMVSVKINAATSAA